MVARAKSLPRARRRVSTKSKAIRGGSASVRAASDVAVAWALANLLRKDMDFIQMRMKEWTQSILKCAIPGIGGTLPSKAQLEKAKRAVLRFYEHERSLGENSAVVQAFNLATREINLKFDWDFAIARVQRAKLDRGKVDSWDFNLALTCGDSNATSEIYLCGKKKMTSSALTSLLCHEGLHNLARRTRRGNPFLSTYAEHVAMALLGDPQLVDHEA